MAEEEAPAPGGLVALAGVPHLNLSIATKHLPVLTLGPMAM